MRLDKFLKNSRLIKRRTIAKEICDNGCIFINGTVAKASTTVKIGDLLLLKIGNKEIKAKVTNIIEIVTKDTASSMYEIID
jgi:ribosomal 50S subunit-recycling heat shock protein